MTDDTKPSRHARLFAAHQSVVRWDGATWFRTQLGQVRRIRTQLAKVKETCAVVLDDDEKATLQAAAALLGRLSSDFELAGRQAKQYEAQLLQERNARKEQERQEIEAAYLGGLDAQGTAEFIEDIARLLQTDEVELRKILGVVAPRYNHLGMSHDLAQLVDLVRAGQPLPDIASAKRIVVLWLDSSIAELSAGSPSISQASFLAFRKHRARMRSFGAPGAYDPSSD